MYEEKPMGAPEPTPSEEPLLAADLAIKLKELPVEEREAYWHAHVYRGDAKQLTVRAIIMGMLLGGVLSLSNLYLGLKLGLTVGVAITAGVLAFAIFKIFERILPGGEFTDLENNAMQSVASAAGFMASAGLISAVPALLLMTGKHMDPLMLAFWISAISLLGVVIAIPIKRQLINNDQLPFPSGTAAAATIQGLHTEGKAAMARAKALGIGGVISGLAAWIMQGGADVTAKLAETVSWLKVMAISLPQTWAPIESFKGIAASKLTLNMNFSLTLYATGALVGPRVGIGLLVGGVLNWMFLVPFLLENKMVEGSVYNWTRWPAVAMLIIITLVALGMQWKSIARAFGSMLGSVGAAATPEGQRAAKIEVPGKWFLIGLAVTGSACVVLANILFGIHPVIGVLSVLLAVVLAMVTARITGETDISQDGAMGKVSQLTFGILAPTSPVTNMMTANIASGAAIHTSDLMTDLKSGYLLGAKPRQQVVAQLFGIAAGSLFCVPAFMLLVPNKEALGTDQIPAPGAAAWQATAEALTKGLSAIPPTALQFALYLVAFGVLITVLEVLFPKSRKFLPSPLGIGMAMLLPFFISFGIFVGSVIGWSISKAMPEKAEKYLLPASAGIIVGESLVVIGMLGVMKLLGML